MKAISATLFIVLSIFAAQTATAAAVTVLDGSFESPVITGGSVAGGGDSWTPSATSGVYVIHNGTGLGNTIYGVQYLGLNPGTSDSQSVPGFLAGTTYTLQASFADLANGTTPTLGITLSGAATSTQLFTAPSGGLYPGNIPFTTATLSFVPLTSGSVTIALTDYSPNGTIGVDNVTFVPEPSSLLAMVAGSLALVAVLRYRTRAPKA